MSVATTRLSSKGQVVIPEMIRRQLNLREGDRFVVVGEGDTVIFKSITPPSLDQWNGLLASARKQAKKAGLKKTDLKMLIAKVRAGK